jgi:hypothetical protein
MPSSVTMDDTLKKFKSLLKELISSEIILNYANNKAQVMFNLRPGHVEDDQQKVMEYIIRTPTYFTCILIFNCLFKYYSRNANTSVS